ncbi:hypothetical protein D3C71_2009770 [compost metagenome]
MNATSSPLTLLHIEQPVCRRTFQLAWHEKRYLSKAACHFRDFVVDYFAGQQKQTQTRKLEAAVK